MTTKPDIETPSNAYDSKTISDFGEQWELFATNEGYFASLDYFQDILEGLVDLEEFRDTTVGEIGSGTGRFVVLLLKAGAKHVVAIEPSAIHETLRQNTAEFSDRITYIQKVGAEIDLKEALDAMICLGVLSYIPDPLPTFRATINALKPGGKFAVCLMSVEGNRLYLATFGVLRKLTVRLPNRILLNFCKFLNVLLGMYIGLCKVLPLPMRTYITNVVGKFSKKKRLLIIFDQLNPTYVKFYRKHELERLFHEAGFENVQLRHRHKYSWAAVGTKPRS